MGGGEEGGRTKVLGPVDGGCVKRVEWVVCFLFFFWGGGGGGAGVLIMQKCKRQGMLSTRTFAQFSTPHPPPPSPPSSTPFSAFSLP